MAGDNTLGAPTEGLGQTVTFGFKTADKVSDVGVQRGRVRAGVQGGSGGGSLPQARAVQVEIDPTVELLLKVGQGIVDKNIKEARTRAYVTGMQRAMTGEAVEDIAKEQPTWSKVFGDSDAIEGARAYSTEATVQKTMLSIESDMPNLRRMDSAGANEFFTKSVQAAMTGHAATDNAIISALQRSMPAVMKRHASEHYAFMQTEAARSESEAIHAGADRLQLAGQQLAEGKITQADYDEQLGQNSMLSVPAAGRDPTNVKQQRARDAMLLAEKGNFHALNAMEKIGLFDLLDPEQKASVMRSRETNELQHRAKYGAERYDELLALKNIAHNPTAGWKGEYTVLALNEFNDTFKKRTGSKTPYFSADAVASAGATTTNAVNTAVHVQMREHEAKTKAEEKVKGAVWKAQMDESAISQSLTTGNLTTLMALTDISADKVNQYVTPRFLSVVNNSLSAKPEDYAPMVRAAIHGYVNKPVQDMLGGMVANAVAGGVMAPSFVATYENWRKMNDVNPIGAAAYFKEDHAKFAKFNMVHPGPIDIQKTGPNLVAAFAGTFGPDAGGTRAKMDKTDLSSLVTSVSKNQNSKWFPEWMGGKKGLRPGTAEFIASQTHATVEVMNVTAIPEDALKVSIPIAQQRGLQIVGGYAWHDNGPGFLKDMQTRLNGKWALPEDTESADIFGDIMDEEIAKVGGMDKVTVMRNEGLLIAFGYKDGVSKRAVLDYNGIAEQMMERSKAKYESGKRRWAFGGPSSVAAPELGAPSIYAGEDAWRKYNQSKRK